MSNYRHLLLATAFSAEGERVAERAVEIRELCGARLSLVHVVEYLPLAYSGDLLLPDDYDLERELVAAAEARMQAQGERLGVAESDRYVLAGQSAREILRIVETQQVDLIVVGNHARHGLAGLFGSTTDSILHHADCDILAVRIG